MVVGEVARPVDVLVIGGGPGGYTAAARAAELGKEVVLVDSGLVGGVCLHSGCIPSKALITVANELAGLEGLASRGITARGDLDFAATQRWKQGVVDGLACGVRRLLSKVEVVAGTARFLDARRVAVESGEQVAHFKFSDAIVATGSRPVGLPGLPLDGSRVVDSTGALALQAVPATLAVVGGGYIGLELGTAYAKLGSRVTVVEALDRLLSGFDPDLVREVERSLQRLGVTVRTKSSPAGVDGGDLVVDSPDGSDRVAAEKVLVAVGRRPNTDDLQLEEAGLTPLPSGHLEVDGRRATGVRGIYAIGDVTAGPARATKRPPRAASPPRRSRACPRRSTPWCR